MPSANVARKYALGAGLVAMLALALVACVAASGADGSAKAPAVVRMKATISVTVPDAGWRLSVERVLERDADVWVLARLRRRPGDAAQMIQQAKAEIPVALPEKKLRVFVAGKTWAWRNEESYEFVASLEEVASRAGPARALYPTVTK